MSSQERVFCRIAEAQFRAYDAAIESAIFFPVSQLKILKGLVITFRNTILSIIESELDYIEEYVDNIGGDNASNIRDNIKDFCRTAYKCKAAMEAMFPEDGNDPIFVRMIPQNIRDQIRNGQGDVFDVFEQYVCKLSLLSMMSEFNDFILDRFAALLDEFLAKLGLAYIDELIADYLRLIEPFLRELDVLRKFADCAFSTCNWTQTAFNRRQDVSNRVGVQEVGEGWAFKAQDWMQDVIDRENNARSRIFSLRDRITLLR